MRLPIDAPVAPMLARLIDELPEASSVPGGYAYEPKWDGFRCIIMRDGVQIELASRMNKSLTAYFPEVLDHLREALPPRCIIDSELIVPTGPEGAQHLDWDALCERIHPSLRRVGKLSELAPAEVVTFDVLALDERDLTREPLRVRRAILEELMHTPVPGVHLTMQTTDSDQARTWFDEFTGHGLDGIMIKEREGAYEFGHRSWLKLKHHRTAEAVIIGYRRTPRYRGVGRLLLGMYGPHDETMHYVGTVDAFTDDERVALAGELADLVVPAHDVVPPVGLHATPGMSTGSVVHVRPERVVEVQYDQLEGRQFRHTAKFRRWRPDREPRSCRLDQLGTAAAYDLGAMLA